MPRSVSLKRERGLGARSSRTVRGRNFALLNKQHLNGSFAVSTISLHGDLDRDPDPGDGSAVAAAAPRERFRGLRRPVRRPRGHAPPRKRRGAVGPGEGLAEPRLPGGALAVPGDRPVGRGALADRRLPGRDRIRRAGGLARLRAGLGPGAALVGAGLRDRGRPGRSGPRVRRPGEGPGNQPHRAGELGLHRVAERIGERLEGRIQHFGREMLCYGIDRETYRA